VAVWGRVWQRCVGWVEVWGGNSQKVQKHQELRHHHLYQRHPGVGAGELVNRVE